VVLCILLINFIGQVVVYRCLGYDMLSVLVQVVCLLQTVTISAWLMHCCDVLLFGATRPYNLMVRERLRVFNIYLR